SGPVSTMRASYGPESIGGDVSGPESTAGCARSADASAVGFVYVSTVTSAAPPPSALPPLESPPPFPPHPAAIAPGARAHAKMSRRRADPRWIQADGRCFSVHMVGGRGLPYARPRAFICVPFAFIRAPCRAQTRFREEGRCLVRNYAACR